ncbi:MAG: hypothetical protein LUH82_02520 [Clostridiales bacterium]|nr:hypothetical protein [Clostridiales bacterium]
MPPFSSQDIDEAKRRVREMQHRADSYVSAESEQQKEPAEKSAAGNSVNAKAAPAQKDVPPGEKENAQQPGNLSEGGAIILILLILLWGEGADNKLLLALLYLLL